MPRKKKSTSKSVSEGSLLASMANSDVSAEELEMLEQLEEDLDEEVPDQGAEDIEAIEAEDELDALDDDSDIEEPENKTSPKASPKARRKPARKSPRKRKSPSKSKSASKIKTAEVEAEGATEEETPEATIAKPKSPRAPRAEKKASEPKPEKVMAEIPVESPQEAPDFVHDKPAVAASSVTEFPAAAVATAAEHLREDVAVTSVTVQKSMESMVKQWGSMKDISDSISKNFERVSHMMQELPRQSIELHEKIRRRASRPTLSTKIAIAASIVAVVLSILSLSMISNMRHTLYQGMAPHAAMPSAIKPAIKKAAPARPSVAPKEANASGISDLGAPAVQPERRRNEEVALATTKRKPSVHLIKYRKRGYQAIIVE